MVSLQTGQLLPLPLAMVYGILMRSSSCLQCRLRSYTQCLKIVKKVSNLSAGIGNFCMSLNFVKSPSLGAKK